jgi:hypothetical protein
MEMSIEKYISEFYCDKKPVDLYEIEDDPNLIYKYEFYNRFHSVWLSNVTQISNKFVTICETKENENEIKSNDGLSISEDNNFISFEESTIWTYLKYIPFKVLLNQLGYPICECEALKSYWWGRLKYQEYKFEKIETIFNIHNIDSEKSKEINLELISKILEKEGVIKNSSANTSVLNGTSYETYGRSSEILDSTQILNSIYNGGKVDIDKILPRR